MVVSVSNGQPEDRRDVGCTNALPQDKILQMIEACSLGNADLAAQLFDENEQFAIQQDELTGVSPLMKAAAAGHVSIVQFLLQTGKAPWNAVDRQGQCAGNYAVNNEQWDCVNVLVDWAVRSELILGTVERNLRNASKNGDEFDGMMTTDIASSLNHSSSEIPPEHEPSEKPDYLQQKLRYTSSNAVDESTASPPTLLLDEDNDAVMMEWERPIMRAHAQILLAGSHSEDAKASGKSVLNIGFGLGIIDSIIQDEYEPRLHYIIEAHPDVHQKMLADGWHKKPNVRICFGKWQSVIPQLIQENAQFDAIFYDTVSVLEHRVTGRFIPLSLQMPR
jgi:type IV protein arginine methyltransferase